MSEEKLSLETMMSMMLQKMGTIEEKIQAIEDRVDPILEVPEEVDVVSKPPVGGGLNPMRTPEYQGYHNFAPPKEPPCPHGIERPYGYEGSDHWCQRCQWDRCQGRNVIAGTESSPGMFTGRRVYIAPT